MFTLELTENQRAAVALALEQEIDGTRQAMFEYAEGTPEDDQVVDVLLRRARRAALEEAQEKVGTPEEGC